MKITDREWKEFKISELFILDKNKRQIPTGAYIHKDNLKIGYTPRITVTSMNNGIDNYWKTVHKNYRCYKNFMSVSFLGDCFYHKYTASLDMKVHCLKLKDFELNENIALFILSCLKNNTKNSSYGNQLSSNDLPAKHFLLPINAKGNPDYQFMEDYVKEIIIKKKQEYVNYVQKLLHAVDNKTLMQPLEVLRWKEFFISGNNGIFNIKASNSGIDKNKLISNKVNNIPYITRTDIDNGISLFTGRNQNKRYSINEKNVITIGLDTQTVFYQPFCFFTGQNIQVLKNNFINKYNALFIKQSLKIQLKKFNWGGNGATLGRLAKTKILLPINSKNEPNYTYMEQYIHNIMLTKYKEYLNYIQTK